MKAILKFDLNDEDDAMAHMRCVKAKNMALFISHLWHHFIDNDSISESNVSTLLSRFGIEIDELIC